jgi:hypothetical protein
MTEAILGEQEEKMQPSGNADTHPRGEAPPRGAERQKSRNHQSVVFCKCIQNRMER